MCLFLLSWLPAIPVLAAPKTDVVVLKSGDRLTGEVQQLERGRLQLKTDDLGTVQIEWDKVASVSATARFDVDDVRGDRYVGSLLPGADAGQLLIVSSDGTTTVELLSVVRLRRLDNGFWKRLDGSLDVGASYTSATELFKVDFAGTLGAERPGHEFSLNGNATLSTQPGVDDIRRSNLTFTYARRFHNRWVALGLAALEQNRELGFELRTSAAGGGGRYLVRSRRDKLLTGLGLSVNHERPTEGETTSNVELIGLVHYDRFGYDYPKVDLSINLAGFASLTDGGRYRVEFGASLKRELWRDFYVSLRGYESYDSRPATEGAHRNDYGITFALGWTF